MLPFQRDLPSHSRKKHFEPSRNLTASVRHIVIVSGRDSHAQTGGARAFHGGRIAVIHPGHYDFIFLILIKEFNRPLLAAFFAFFVEDLRLS
jgi:hypothetical protein